MGEQPVTQRARVRLHQPPDLAQRDLELAEAPDGEAAIDLVGRVQPIAGIGIDTRRRQEPQQVVASERGLIERTPADDGSKRRLRDLADRLIHVLNRNNGSDGILDPEVRDGGHVNRHVVLGDDCPATARFVGSSVLPCQCVAQSLPRLA